MEFIDELQVIEFIKNHQKTPSWIDKARKDSKVLNALITGKDFDKVLIEKIEKIESDARKVAREKYSKDIRDMFDRVMKPRTNVFSASGGSIHNDISSEKLKDKFIRSLNHFKGQKSIKKYLSEDFFRLGDTDPNGLIFLEYKEDINIWPTYKSTNDIRFYISNGQLLEVLLFEPEMVLSADGKVSKMIWRVVDDKKEYRVEQMGSEFRVMEEGTFEHQFGNVPATILSDRQETGSELRISSIFPIIPLAEDYARDKSVLTI